MNTKIWTVIREYEYEYKYLSHTKPKINMLMYIKAIKVGKNNAYVSLSVHGPAQLIFCWIQR